MLARASLLAVFALSACAVDPASMDDQDPNLDGKADAKSATREGGVGWNRPASLLFANAGGDAIDLAYQTFELSGDADVTFETTAPSDASLDTVLYLYAPTADRWGAYIARNDDGGAGKLSKLASHLGAGTYRVLVRRKLADGTPRVGLVATCSGDGCAPPVRGCTPTEPRSAEPEVFIGPDNWETSINAAIDSATTSLDVQIYLFTVTDIAAHLIAAEQRGVPVRILHDGNSQRANDAAVVSMLEAAGVSSELDPPAFSFAHAKYMIVDGDRAVIMSGNFNGGAVKTTGGGERNYGFIDRDSDDVADLQAVFDADWAAGPEPDLSCTRLIVSPVNSGQRILDHAKSALHTLDIEVLYLDEADLQAAVVAAAANNVVVRVLLSDPVKNPQNTETQSYLQSHGVAARFLVENYLHAKMIQADGIALVGSENMSVTSWTKNREVGALLFEQTPSAQIHQQFEADWASAQTP